MPVVTIRVRLIFLHFMQRENLFERQREHARTPEAVMGKVLRGIVAEGTFAEAVRHGLK